MRWAKFLAVLSCMVGGSSCGISQLNHNTVELSTTIDDLYTRQVLLNFSKFIDAENALPSQVDIAAGTVQTNRSVTPSLSFPFSDALTTVVGATKTVSTAITHASSLTKTNSTPNVGASVTGTNAWQQNWTIAPVTDANTLRRLRALYRYVLFETNIYAEYKPSVAASYEYPQCVLCKSKNGRMHVNPDLKPNWLYWTSDAGSAPPRLPPDYDHVIDLGHYGNHRLFMRWADYQAGYLSNFTLFTMPISVAAGAAGAKKSEAPPRQNFELFVPQQILPAQ